MEGKMIFERVPIFGDIEVNIKNESSKAFSVFSDEIDRLKEINQLGILHDFLNIPPYRKYDYIITMIYLSQMASRYSQNSELRFDKKVKLADKIYFSSSEEMLKCWCLLYSIGHAKTTFAGEHAFMKCIPENKEEVIEYIKNKLDLDIKNEIDKRLLSKIKIIINRERYMEIYKIFTILKIKDNDKLAKNNYYGPKFLELAKIMILKDDYLELLELERRKKIEKIINYFEVIRKLTFTILDGSISQNHLNINYFAVFEDLDDFMESQNYQQLLNDINKFYTSDIFNSPESSYYHYRCVFNIESIYKKYNILKLIEKIVKNDSILENRVTGDIKKLKKSIDDKNEPIDETNKQFIKSEIKDHFRINFNFTDIRTPVTLECNSFKLDGIFGGVLFNLSKSIYEIDIYPTSENSDKIITEYNILNIINSLYDLRESFLPDFFGFIHKLKKLYDKVNESGITDFEDEVNSLEPYKSQFLSQIDGAVLSIQETDLVILINKFNELATYLFKNTVNSSVMFSSWEVTDYRIDFPIFFRKSELEIIINLLKKAKNIKELEHKNVLEQLEIELNIVDEESDKIFYVLAPNTNFLKENRIETEIDSLLIKYILPKKKKILKIGEVKPKGRFEEDQCIKQLEIIFDIPKSTAMALFKGTSKKSKEYSVKTHIKGEKADSIITFEKSEDLIFKDS